MGGSAGATRKPSPIVRRLRREPTIDAATAFSFLGIEDDVGYRLMAAYRLRTARLVESGRPLDMEQVKPRRAKDGSWAEIPNFKVGGKVRCRSDLLLWMVFPEGIS